MTIYQTLMNEIKNSSAPGTYVQPLPIGIWTKLHYSDKGILTKATYEIKNTVVEIPFNIVVSLAQSEVLIQRLQMYKAECTVFGVLTAPMSEIKFEKCAGIIPQCFYPAMLKLAESKPQVFNFYAVDVQSADGRSFPAAAAINRLAVMKFNVISGLLPNSSNFASILSQLHLTVKSMGSELPLLAGLYIHGATYIKTLTSSLKCGKVPKCDYTLDINGYVHGRLKCDLGDGEIEASCPYTQVVKYHLSNNSFVVMDTDNNIQYVSQPKMFARVAPETITCPICKKQYTVNINSDLVSCVDAHCASKLYPQVCRLLSKFNLPMMSKERFLECTSSGALVELHDVFNLPEYKDTVVETTLSTLIEAITPVSLLAGDASAIFKFVQRASSNSAVSYYIDNPDAITADLKLNNAFDTRFKEFWSDKFNAATYDTFINSPYIQIVSPNKKFEGDLIFRNKLICLTGEFKHGSYDDMFAILQSYAGTPTVEFTSQVSYVIVGHFGKPDPYIVEKARAYSIPIYTELDFFNAYQIDNDLRKRHLI